MNRAIIGGSAYFLALFTAGLFLGALRMFVVQPAVGELRAVLIELPIMLAISWAACLRLVCSAAVPRRAPSRIAMGAWALLLLLIVEFGTAASLIGRWVFEQVDEYRRSPMLIGLAAQLGYAAFPLLMARRARR